MSSVCISKCVEDARDARVPVRASYVNLYKWPESDAEFVRRRSSVRRGGGSGGSEVYGGTTQYHRRVVDSISCRQVYLRSYKFSRKESVPEKTQKCFGRVKEKVAHGGSASGRKISRSSRRKCLVWRKMKEFSCAALFRIFHRFLSCGAGVDVVH